MYSVIHNGFLLWELICLPWCCRRVYFSVPHPSPAIKMERMILCSLNSVLRRQQTTQREAKTADNYRGPAGVTPQIDPNVIWSPAVNQQPGDAPPPSINHQLTHISPVPLPSRPGWSIMTYTCLSVALRNVFHANSIWTHIHTTSQVPPPPFNPPHEYPFLFSYSTKSSLTFPVWFAQIQTYVGLLFNLSFERRTAALKHNSPGLLTSDICMKAWKKKALFFSFEVFMIQILQTRQSIKCHRRYIESKWGDRKL